MPVYKKALWRMNRRLVAGSAAVLIAVGGIAGSTTVMPYISSEFNTAASQSTSVIDVGSGTTSLFDDTSAHSISIQIDQDALDEMLSDYQEDGDKTWEKATVTIDGVTIEDVGVRLKGNSTLRALSGNGAGGSGGEQGGGPGGSGGEQNGAQGGGPGGAERPDMPTPPDGVSAPGGTSGDATADAANFPAPPAGAPSGEEMPTGASQGDMSEPGQMGEPGAMGGPGGGGMDAGISEDDASTYPLLLSFDKYQEGRTYQGMSQLSVRPGTDTLSEALALNLTAQTDQVSQQGAFVTYSVNDSDTTTRLVIENPDENYADELGNGVLFKADAQSKFSYQGDDQSDYTDQFKQLNGEGSSDVQPIISFLKWLDSADEEEFAEHLGDYLDVESYARYLATQNLLVNQDDMEGPGRNFYLWYDNDTGLLSVISWDLNMAMAGQTSADPTDSVTMGGGGQPGGQGGPVGAGDAGDAGGGQPGELGGERASATAEGDSNEATDADAADSTESDSLRSRFLAIEEFSDLYQQEYWDLYDQIFASGVASQTVQTLAAAMPVTDAVTAEAIEQQASQLQNWITSRSDYLATVRNNDEADGAESV
ncbi:CotH kinase family protein [Corynebacterium sp. MSK151]|uniref:CotH kinase family protein n=1 Tax=unclassified Corynebacterium TaxID=2624378 RepID=UPI00254B67B8|nr:MULTISPECIES: CotH kinase family protein [unclassified Corynebacterium]MDK8759903.1 CotH kinase family protein [Corynebacterium sp. MSK151]MDK8848876.1 CotH kinase family protein [Corynebacterium sp. MSK047]